jgi:sensor c-di-GMP phosphodiesterase-like protein
MLDLAHHLGLSVVAEGVEDRRTWARLAELGCQFAQGSFLARPMAPDDIDRWSAEHGEAPPVETAAALLVGAPCHGSRLPSAVGA